MFGTAQIRSQWKCFTSNMLCWYFLLSLWDLLAFLSFCRHRGNNQQSMRWFPLKRPNFAFAIFFFSCYAFHNWRVHLQACSPSLEMLEIASHIEGTWNRLTQSLNIITFFYATGLPICTISILTYINIEGRVRGRKDLSLNILNKPNYKESRGRTENKMNELRVFMSCVRRIWILFMW